MKAMLVLNNDKVSNLRIMVDLRKRDLVKQVISLLEEDKCREAFDLLRNKANVIECFPRGKKLSQRPEITLFEDML